jgi:rhomboid protease GluP
MKFANKQTEQLPLENLTVSQFLTLAIEASNLLGWIFGDINNTGFVAYTNNGIFSWNAELRLKINDQTASIQSASRGDGVVDVRENKKNLQSFIATFNSLKKSIAVQQEQAVKYATLKPGFSSN